METPGHEPASEAGRDVDGLLELAVELARRAAEIHRSGRTTAPATWEKSSPFDLVTAVDREAEKVIVHGITSERPLDAILGEEGANREGTSGIRWIVDPLDGTTNYVYRYPEYSVSIGIEADGQPVAGVVLHSARGDLYTGIRGRGAWANGEPIAVSAKDDLQTALVATGFAYDPGLRRRQAEVMVHLLPRIRDLRRGGSAALDLCSVASGIVDLYYECPVAPWDVAAGRVIAEAAGAAVIVREVPSYPGCGVITANPRLLAKAIPVLLEAGLDLRVPDS